MFRADITILSMEVYRILQSCSALEELYLGLPKDKYYRSGLYVITTDQHTSIANLLTSLQRLKRLYLCYGWMIDSILEFLSSAIASNIGLHLLDLSGSRITSASLSTLIRLIASLSSIGGLYVRHTEIDDSTECQDAIEKLRENTSDHQPFTFVYSVKKHGMYFAEYKSMGCRSSTP